MSGFEIRPLRTLEEYEACVALQEVTWGRGFSEKVPVAILMVSARLGGVVAGAFDPAGELVGFVFGMTGWEGGKPLHWSDMLAVRPEIRERGLGVRLKAFQREELLGRGVREVRWTFDPLESKNAFLNLGKLGAVAREYVPNMYGTTGSSLHGDLPTDRLVVSWLLDATRVRERLAGDAPPPGPGDVGGIPRFFSVTSEEGRPAPGALGPDPTGPRVLVPIPADFYPIRTGDPDLAMRWRRATRAALSELTLRGYEATELIRGGNVSHYLLVRTEGENPVEGKRPPEGEHRAVRVEESRTLEEERE